MLFSSRTSYSTSSLSHKKLSGFSRPSSTTLKVIVAVTGSGLFGVVLIGGGAALFFTVGLYPAIGVGGAGILIDGGALVGLILYSCLSKKMPHAPWFQNDNLKSNLDQGTLVKGKSNRHFTRVIVKYKENRTTKWFVKAQSPQITTQLHGYVHPFNDFVAYQLDQQVLKLQVIPETLWYSNHHDLASANLFPRVSKHFKKIPHDSPVIAQQALRNKHTTPKPTNEKQFIKQLNLNTEQAHRVILFNLIAGRRDNHRYRIENDAVLKNGNVFPIDNDQLGFSLQNLFCLHNDHGSDDHPAGLYHLYYWLLDHSVADKPFSDEIRAHILAINPKDLNRLFHSLSATMQLDNEFKKNICNNLKAVQKALSDNKEITPKQLFSLLNTFYKKHLESGATQ